MENTQYELYNKLLIDRSEFPPLHKKLIMRLIISNPKELFKAYDYVINENLLEVLDGVNQAEDIKKLRGMKKMSLMEAKRITDTYIEYPNKVSQDD